MSEEETWLVLVAAAENELQEDVGPVAGHAHVSAGSVVESGEGTGKSTGAASLSQLEVELATRAGSCRAHV